jgi:hypothetical protein
VISSYSFDSFLGIIDTLKCIDEIKELETRKCEDTTIKNMIDDLIESLTKKQKIISEILKLQDQIQDVNEGDGNKVKLSNKKLNEFNIQSRRKSLRPSMELTKIQVDPKERKKKQLTKQLQNNVALSTSLTPEKEENEKDSHKIEENKKRKTSGQNKGSSLPFTQQSLSNFLLEGQIRHHSPHSKPRGFRLPFSKQNSKETTPSIHSSNSSVVSSSTPRSARIHFRTKRTSNNAHNRTCSLHTLQKYKTTNPKKKSSKNTSALTSSSNKFFPNPDLPISPKTPTSSLHRTQYEYPSPSLSDNLFSDLNSPNCSLRYLKDDLFEDKTLAKFSLSSCELINNNQKTGISTFNKKGRVKERKESSFKPYQEKKPKISIDSDQSPSDSGSDSEYCSRNVSKRTSQMSQPSHLSLNQQNSKSIIEEDNGTDSATPKSEANSSDEMKRINAIIEEGFEKEPPKPPPSKTFEEETKLFNYEPSEEKEIEKKEEATESIEKAESQEGKKKKEMRMPLKTNTMIYQKSATIQLDGDGYEQAQEILEELWEETNEQNFPQEHFEQINFDQIEQYAESELFENKHEDDQNRKFSECITAQKTAISLFESKNAKPKNNSDAGICISESTSPSKKERAIPEITHSPHSEPITPLIPPFLPSTLTSFQKCLTNISPQRTQNKSFLSFFPTPVRPTHNSPPLKETPKEDIPKFSTPTLSKEYSLPPAVTDFSPNRHLTREQKHKQFFSQSNFMHQLQMSKKTLGSKRLTITGTISSFIKTPTSSTPQGTPGTNSSTSSRTNTEHTGSTFVPLPISTFAHAAHPPESPLAFSFKTKDRLMLSPNIRKTGKNLPRKLNSMDINPIRRLFDFEQTNTVVRQKSKGEGKLELQNRKSLKISQSMKMAPDPPSPSVKNSQQIANIKSMLMSLSTCPGQGDTTRNKLMEETKSENKSPIAFAKKEKLRGNTIAISPFSQAERMSFKESLVQSSQTINENLIKQMKASVIKIDPMENFAFLPTIREKDEDQQFPEMLKMSSVPSEKVKKPITARNFFNKQIRKDLLHKQASCEDFSACLILNPLKQVKSESDALNTKHLDSLTSHSKQEEEKPGFPLRKKKSQDKKLGEKEKKEQQRMLSDKLKRQNSAGKLIRKKGIREEVGELELKDIPEEPLNAENENDVATFTHALQESEIEERIENSLRQLNKRKSKVMEEKKLDLHPQSTHDSFNAQVSQSDSRQYSPRSDSSQEEWSLSPISVCRSQDVAIEYDDDLKGDYQRLNLSNYLERFSVIDAIYEKYISN